MADHLPHRVQPAKNGGIFGISEYAMKKSNNVNTNAEWICGLEARVVLIRELRNIELLLNIQENAAHKYGGKRRTKHCCTYVPPRPKRLLHMCSA